MKTNCVGSVVCDGVEILGPKNRELMMLIEKRLRELGLPVTRSNVSSYYKSLILSDIGR